MKFTIESADGATVSDRPVTLEQEEDEMGYDVRSVEVKGLDDLMAMAESVGYRLVIAHASDEEPDDWERRLRGVPHIVIYDGYLE